MKTALITGSDGFIGRHVVEALRRIEGVRVLECHRRTAAADLEAALREAEVVVHLAGVNRPTDPAEFTTGNAGLTETLCARLEAMARHPLVIFSSSIQAGLDNPYGVSKRAAETALEQWATRGGGRAIVFRLHNVFGKWCRPNYNSVTATFCHNIAHDLPVTISDPDRPLELIYIDDIVAGIRECVDLPPTPGFERREISPRYRVTLGELAAKIRSFRESRRTLVLPSFADDFTRRLYATYLSYLEGKDFAYSLEQRIDPRGTLAEFIKSAQFGQIFVSRTKPGITRGNHYHHTKTEKFLVLEGQAVIRFRQINGAEIIEHRVDGRDFKVLDIPPGYTHLIENTGTTELVTLFWASEIFEPQRPDTMMLPVRPAQ